MCMCVCLLVSVCMCVLVCVCVIREKTDWNVFLFFFLETSVPIATG